MLAPEENSHDLDFGDKKSDFCLHFLSFILLKVLLLICHNGFNVLNPQSKFKSREKHNKEATKHSWFVLWLY